MECNKDETCYERLKRLQNAKEPQTRYNGI
ncbi:hypothetical protein DET56_110141 [Paenibacillus pabuli]|uniref:Uncharacterized protein n=1 Tax=Paenibacillus pabuli TaxID=1472 RepID=A0A855Y5T6_9BACL|nr:hypothetical protein DET56_110141 [Paenibacillus pabuli]PXW04191.1 hypothetical protein DEU73_109157 [Paenibacillus taichungensis]